MAHAIHYLESVKSEKLKAKKQAQNNQTSEEEIDEDLTFNSQLSTFNSLVLCSIGDGAMTEGEVSEALQMAVLHQLPIIYLVQDNDWGISATGREMRIMDAYEFAAGFPACTGCGSMAPILSRRTMA